MSTDRVMNSHSIRSLQTCEDEGLAHTQNYLNESARIKTFKPQQKIYLDDGTSSLIKNKIVLQTDKPTKIDCDCKDTKLINTNEIGNKDSQSDTLEMLKLINSSDVSSPFRLNLYESNDSSKKHNSINITDKSRSLLSPSKSLINSTTEKISDSLNLSDAAKKLMEKSRQMEMNGQSYFPSSESESESESNKYNDSSSNENTPAHLTVFEGNKKCDDNIDNLTDRSGQTERRLNFPVNTLANSILYNNGNSVMPLTRFQRKHDIDIKSRNGKSHKMVTANRKYNQNPLYCPENNHHDLNTNQLVTAAEKTLQTHTLNNFSPLDARYSPQRVLSPAAKHERRKCIADNASISKKLLCEHVASHCNDEIKLGCFETNQMTDVVHFDREKRTIDEKSEQNCCDEDNGSDLGPSVSLRGTNDGIVMITTYQNSVKNDPCLITTEITTVQKIIRDESCCTLRKNQNNIRQNQNKTEDIHIDSKSTSNRVPHQHLASCRSSTELCLKGSKCLITNSFTNHFSSNLPFLIGCLTTIYFIKQNRDF